MSEKPMGEYGAGDTNLVSHDFEPAERFMLRLRGDEKGVYIVDVPPPDDIQVHGEDRELVEAIRFRDAALRLAVLEEAARVCHSAEDARAIRDLKRRPSLATS